MTLKYPLSRIEVFRPHIGEEEIDAVAAVMRSGWIGRGPKVEEFESEWAAHIGVNRENVVSVGCATEALYQVMWQLAGNGMFGKGSTVIIPDNSFIGTASAVLESGMSVKVCDINKYHLNPNIVEYHREKSDSTVALVFQHYGGFSPNIDMIARYCRLKDMDYRLIEDFACHPMGKPVGDFAVWSFDAMKVITCGDGGMVYCRDVEAAQAIRDATRLGMDTASGQSSQAANWWSFNAHVPGRRSMMNDIGAAIGLVQLRRLPQMVARRQEIWNYYQSGLMRLDWLTLPDGGLIHWGGTNSYYTYWLTLPVDGMRDRLAHYLRERGIYTTYRYQSVSRAYGWDNVNVPNSHWANDHVLNLPLHPGLSDNDVSYVCECISAFSKTAFR